MDYINICLIQQGYTHFVQYKSAGYNPLKDLKE